MNDPFGGDYPEIWVARDGVEPERLEFTDLGVDSCPKGHIHGIVVGDSEAVKAFLADSPERAPRTEIDRDIRRLIELRGSDLMFVGNMATGLNEESRAFVDQVLADASFSEGTRAGFEAVRAIDDQHKAGVIDGPEAQRQIGDLMLGMLEGSDSEAEVRSTTLRLPDAAAAQGVESLLEESMAGGVLDTDVLHGLIEVLGESLTQDPQIPESWREHIARVTDIGLRAAQGEVELDELRMEQARFLVDPRYLRDYLAIESEELVGQQAKREVEGYNCWLEAGMNGIDVPGGELIEGRPDLIERALDEYEAQYGN